MKNKLMLLFNNQHTLVVNWAKVLLFATYFTYGFYAVISKHNNIFFTSLSILVLIFFYYISKKYENFFFQKIIIKKLDFLIFFLFLFILLIVNINFINLSIFGDELAHIIRSSRTSIYGIITVIEKFDLTYFDNIKFKYLVHLINFILLLFLILIAYLIFKLNNLYSLCFIILSTILFRIFLKDLGMHPPLDHIFSFITFSVLGISDLTANLSYLVGFSIFVFYLYKLIENKLNYQLSFFSTISIFTIPLLLSMSTWTESAIWAAILFTIIIIEIFYFEKINYLRVVVIISLATLFRISLFITLLPLFSFFLIELINKKKLEFSELKKTFLIFSPTLIFLPFLLNSIFFGTPSFEGVLDNPTRKLSIVKKLILAIDSNIIWITALNSISLVWLVFIVFSFNKRAFSNIILISYIVFSIVVYYSINQNLWGLAKYASEYALPICILGFLNFLYLITKTKINNHFIIFCLIFLSFFNVKQFYSNLNNIKPQDDIIDTYHKDIKRLNNETRLFNYKLVFNLVETFEYIKEKNLQGSTLVVGTTYGFLPEIINGYKVKEILKTKKIIENQKFLKKNNINLVERLSSDPNIKAIVLTDLKNREEILEQLKINGWIEEKKFFNLKYGSTVYLLLI